MFQFPTGWNSTLVAVLSGGAVLSFNSQRDGILQCFIVTSEFLDVVSIPNGMEFYSATKHPLQGHLSFNSQRDGILRAISFIFTDSF